MRKKLQKSSKKPVKEYLLAGLVVTLVLAIPLAVVLNNQNQNRQSNAAGHYYFGTLQTDPAKAQLEHDNGIEVAYLSMYWGQYETSDGVFNDAYMQSIKSKYQTLKNAGALIELNIGIHHPPAWLLSNYPDTAFVDQYGDRYTETPNIVFSQKVRERAQLYINKVNQELGLNNFWAIRVGNGSAGEYMYPPSGSYNGHVNTYWAYDSYAQSTASGNPFPGWKPGQTTYNGQPFTTAQVSQWYDWYLKSLADGHNWLINYYKSIGYTGNLKVLIAGTGYYPSSYRTQISKYLDGSNAASLMGLGVGFFKTIPLLTNQPNIQIVPTSLVNGSGNPKNNGCDPSDVTVDLEASPANPVIYDWSSMRWVSTIAKKAGFTLLNGESAGPQISPYYAGVIDDAANQMASCGLQGIMWAFDGNLYDGTVGSSLADYASVIIKYNPPATATPLPPTETPTPTDTPTPLPTATPIPIPTVTPVPADVTPPSVSLTYPGNGVSFSRGTGLTITASASDNVGVQRVEFYVNNSLKCTDTTASYSCYWKVPNKRTSYSLKAVAYDTAGNKTTSSQITIYIK